MRITSLTQIVKDLSAMSETLVRSLGEEDPLDKGTATHLSIIAWRIPWAKEPGELPSSMGSQIVGHDLVTEHENVQTDL